MESLSLGFHTPTTHSFLTVLRAGSLTVPVPTGLHACFQHLQGTGAWKQVECQEGQMLCEGALDPSHDRSPHDNHPIEVPRHNQ